MFRMVNFGVELRAVKLLFRVFDCAVRAFFAIPDRAETFRKFFNIVVVAHPNHGFFL